MRGKRRNNFQALVRLTSSPDSLPAASSSNATLNALLKIPWRNFGTVLMTAALCSKISSKSTSSKLLNPSTMSNRRKFRGTRVGTGVSSVCSNSPSPSETPSRTSLWRLSVSDPLISRALSLGSWDNNTNRLLCCGRSAGSISDMSVNVGRFVSSIMVGCTGSNSVATSDLIDAGLPKTRA